MLKVRGYLAFRKQQKWLETYGMGLHAIARNMIALDGLSYRLIYGKYSVCANSLEIKGLLQSSETTTNFSVW